MLTITGTRIDPEFSRAHELECGLVDYASITAAERNERALQGCLLVPEYAVSFQPVEDQVIPLFFCKLHFNSFAMGLHEGVAADEDLFGEFPKG